MKHNRLYTVEGVKDYLPEEYAFKEETEKRIEKIFKSYGFNPVKSPMFEYIEVFEGKGGINSKQMYKFVDRDGSILALRSDMTTAIARIASTAYGKDELPLRFYYIENAFRYNENYQGKAREFTQAGVELIGVNSAYADAEILAVAVNSIISAGISDFLIDIGHIDFLEGILDEGNFSEADREHIHKLVLKKEYVEVEEFVKNMDINSNVKEILTQLPFMIGGIDTLKSIKSLAVNEKSLKAVSELENIYEILKTYGVEEYVKFDLSIMTHLDYYTGITFRGYCSGTGVAILNGGRYDGLISKFDMDTPAVGFAIKVNEIMNALEARNKKYSHESNKVLAFSSEGAEETAVKVSESLRKKGMCVENGLIGSDITKNKAYALKNGFKKMICFEDSEKARVVDFLDGNEKIIGIDELLNGGY